MSFFSINLYSGKVGFVLIAIAVTGIALVYAKPNRARRDHTSATPAAAPNQPPETSNIAEEVELIDLRRSGFEPREITRPAGRFLLGVNNRTGLTDLSLMLVNESGKSAGSKRLSTVKTWREVFDLHPGRYLLREATHRDWICRITITAR